MSDRLRVTIGLLFLAAVVVILTSLPSWFLPRGVQFIDTELRGASDKGRFVRTLMDLGDSEVMESLPLEDLGWSRSAEDMEQVESQLGADTILAWSCHHESMPHLVWFLILQSKDLMAFHPPPVCYQSQGWDVQEEETISIPVSGDDWAVGPLVDFLEGDERIYQGEINVKKLVITKECGGMTCHRRVVLYYYIKPTKSGMPSEVTMVRVSAPVPVTGSYEHVLELEKLLIADSTPLMFASARDEKTVFEWLLDRGVLGGLAIAILFLLPIGFIMYPSISKRIRPAGTVARG